MKRAILFLALFAVVSAPSVYADNLSPTDDAYTYSRSQNQGTNYGSSSFLDVGKLFTNTTQGYLKFDLSSYSVGISSAYLYLYQPLGVGTANVNAYSTSTLWTEGSINWNNQPAVSGTPVTVSVGTGEGWYCWDVTSLAQLAAGNNFALALTSSDSLRAFYSSEALSSNKPYLSVTAVPEPVSTILFITGGSVLLARRMRKAKK